MTIWSPEPPAIEGQPVYLGIARALEADVRAGRLVAGARLPTHRELAERLGVNVGTVSRAYAECERGGWIRGEVGRGTFVRGEPAAAPEERFGRAASGGGDAPIDLGLNYPVEDPAPDLAVALRTLAAEVEAGRSADFLGYRGPEGAPEDREAGSAALALHGVRAAADRVVIAAGAQHGLSTTLAATCRPGDAVAAESLSYPGLRAAAESRGLRVVAVEMDEQGVRPEAFEAVCASARPRVLYLSPTLQNPTTQTLGTDRRERICEIAERNQVWILEDDVHRMLAPEPPPALAAIAPDRVVHVASLSKCLAPALRIAYLAVPQVLMERVVDQVWASVWTSSPLTAALASGWVRDGTFSRVAIGRRAEAAARQDLAAEVLAGLPPGFAAASAPTAYHLWLRLPEPWNATAFASAARDRGVVVTPAEAFHLGPGPAPAAVRISLSCAPDRAVLHRGLQSVVAAAHGGAASRVRV